MPRGGGLKIVSETNLGRVGNSDTEKYKEVLVCLDNSYMNSDLQQQHNASFILSDTTNRTTMREMTTAAAAAAYSGQRTFVNLDNKSWQGGVTTIVSPGDGDSLDDVREDTPPAIFLPVHSGSEQQRSESELVTAVRSRGGGRRPAIKLEEELSPEEEERLRIRRERNKQAAARCRKRRVDQTMYLQNEVDEHEAKKRQLQEEIQNLTAQRQELQFILDAHRAGGCRLGPPSPDTKRPTSKDSALTPRGTAAGVVVKAEPPVANEFTSIHHQNVVVSRHLTHEEALQNPLQSTGVVELLAPPPVSFAASTRRPQRPASLSFQSSLSGGIKPSVSLSINNNNNNASLHLRYSAATTTTIEGVPIETPTSVVNSLNFDALMDGRTGLTPTNILTPISLSFTTSSSLNTPTLTTPSSSSGGCSSQQRGHHHPTLSELIGSPDGGLMKLVSL